MRRNSTDVEDNRWSRRIGEVTLKRPRDVDDLLRLTDRKCAVFLVSGGEIHQPTARKQFRRMDDESDLVCAREVAGGVTLHVLVAEVKLNDVRFAAFHEVERVMESDRYAP